MMMALSDDALPQVEIAPLIDHSLLIPTATEEQVIHWCSEADRYGFAAVCVNPCHVRLVREQLQGKSPQVCTVIGFPTGATTAASKLHEAQEATENGATELDVMINLGWVKTGQSNRIHRELAEICDETGQVIKAILETALLTPPEIQLAAEVALDAGVSFLKTSTGWNGGATVEAVRQLHDIGRGRVGIKASGGIRTLEQALRLIQAGANRLGTSRGPDLVQQQDEAPRS
jgi:deoxyribose-phosphate aldolase